MAVKMVFRSVFGVVSPSLAAAALAWIAAKLSGIFGPIAYAP